MRFLSANRSHSCPIRINQEVTMHHLLTSKFAVHLFKYSGMQVYFFMVIGCVFFITCDVNRSSLSPEDEKLLELAYDRDYQYPVGFYYEKNLTGSVYYENTVSVKPISDREHIWIELHTSEFDEARKWSDLSNEYSSVNRELIAERTTDKYFEFTRVNVQNKSDTLLSRIHRTDYFVSHYNKFSNIDTVGVYNGEWTINNIKELIEYLWSCGTLNTSDKVISSSISNIEDDFVLHLESLRIVHGDFGLIDMIYVYDNEFTINRTTKTLIMRRELLKELEGRQTYAW